ncbi:MAG: carboxypeptidase regulatory-like domain-containing protein [Myxococcaceae bacterium]|nr:carboxypeptidase regulatory-like domain-containing protein [Myxococcaceae bacterium]
MRRALPSVVAVVLLIVAIGLGVFKALTPGAPTGEGDDATRSESEGPRRSKWFWQSDEPAPEEPVLTPPRARLLRIVLASTGKPMPDVKVRVLRSALLQGGKPGSHSPLECDDLRHLADTAARLREGQFAAEVVAEGVSNAEGVVEFPERAWPTSPVMVLEPPGRPAVAFVESYVREEIVIEDAPIEAVRPTTANVFDLAGTPISGARATIVDVSTGVVTVERSGSAGELSLGAGGARWAIIEAEGFFPVSANLEQAGPDLPVMMSRPGTVEVTAAASLGAFEVKLAKVHERVERLRDGRAVFEDERAGFVSVNVVDPGFLGSGDGNLEEGQRLVIALQVKRAARLLLTVIDKDGNPVPDASATLSAPAATVSASAMEEGQRLELGPIGEGPAVLQVLAPRFKTRAQSLDVRPGDTDLEVVLAEAPSLRGKVVDATGQPVAEVSVQVQSDLPNDPGGAVTGPDGTFQLHVDDEGSWRVEALGLDGEVARAVAQVPGPDVVLKLEPLGRADVLVYAPDGRPADAARVMLASAESPEPDFGETTPEGTLLFESLVPGEYRVEVDDGMNGEQFLRWQGELVVRSGEVARLTVRLRAAGKVVGTLRDPDGAPLAWTVISVKGDAQRLAETGEDGHFELQGLEPGATVELALESSDFVALSPSAVRVGGPPITVKALRGQQVSGRVVDEGGAPVTTFMVNAIDVEASDGRFEAHADAQGVLLISSFTDPIIEVRVTVGGRKDVGDVVLRRSPPFVGQVIDETRQPMPSVRVTSREFVLGEVLTDASGRFEAELLSGAAEVTIEARHGDLGAVVTVPAAKGSAEVVLVSATRVSGEVRGSGGRPIVTSVVVRGPGEEELRVDTDEQGRFSLSLAPGNWFFGTRASRASLAVAVSGKELRVDLGVPDDACELTVRGVPLPGNVYLVPATSSWVPDETVLFETIGTPPGTVTLGLDGPAFVGRGLPCGSYQVHALYGSETVSSQVTLSRGTPGALTVRSPSLSGVGDSVGMRHSATLPRVPEAIESARPVVERYLQVLHENEVNREIEE